MSWRLVLSFQEKASETKKCLKVHSPCREFICIVVDRTIGVVLAKSVGAHILSPQTLDAGHEVTGFGVCCAAFPSCFGLGLLFSSSFGMEILILPLYIRRM